MLPHSGHQTSQNPHPSTIIQEQVSDCESSFKNNEAIANNDFINFRNKYILFFMYESIEDQAILHLLHIADEEQTA